MVHKHALIPLLVRVHRLRILLVHQSHQLVLFISNLLKLPYRQLQLLLSELILCPLFIHFFIQLHFLSAKSRFLTCQLHIHHIELLKVWVLLHQFLSDLCLRLIFVHRQGFSHLLNSSFLFLQLGLKLVNFWFLICKFIEDHLALFWLFLNRLFED